MIASIEPASPKPGRPEQWVYCFPAYGALVHRLPLLYKVVEGHDVVTIELRLSTGAFEVLWVTKAGDDQVAVSVSMDLYIRSEQPFPDHLSYAATKLDSDLQWASTRDCAEQGHELLSALTGFRGLVIDSETTTDIQPRRADGSRMRSLAGWRRLRLGGPPVSDLLATQREASSSGRDRGRPRLRSPF